MPNTPADLKAWRKKHGLSQRGAAALVGAKTRTWEDWEAGKRKPPAMLWVLLPLLNV